MESEFIGRLGDRGARLRFAIGTTLVFGAFACGFAMNNSRLAAMDAAQSFAACDQAATVIQTLRQRSLGPLVAGGAEPMQEITRRIEEAAAASNLPARDIKTVSPQQPQRIEKSPYSEIATQIEIGDATLAQTTAFLGKLCPTGGGLRLSAIHLSTADRAAEAQMVSDKLSPWTADVTVSYTTTGRKAE